MEDAMDRTDIEVIELDEDIQDAFTPEKLAGVAVLGALGSLLLYYLYNQLDKEKRDSLRESLMSLARGQVRQWGESSGL